MQLELFPTEQFTLFSLGSGSCGNCYYLGTSAYGILIDAGIGPRVIKKRLAQYQVDMSSIRGVLITHDHYDHICSASYLGSKLNIPIYATTEVHHAITYHPKMKYQLDNGSKRVIRKRETFRIEALSITPFDVPHDSCDNVGYHIEFGGQRLTLVTDVGCFTDEMIGYIKAANHLIIESNYDELMLQRGSYTPALKQRIAGGKGHVSNKQTADFLAGNYQPHCRNICLCHLSRDNNNPQLAYQTTFDSLMAKGIGVGSSVQLHVFTRNEISPLIELR